MKIRVLVVDDDEDLLFLAGKFLAKEDGSSMQLFVIIILVLIV